MAYDHARRHRPKEVASISDPNVHFSRLGQEVEVAVDELRHRLLGSQRPDEDLEAYRQRSYQARRQAEEVILAEMVWKEPEPRAEPEDDEILSYRSRLAQGSRALAGLDETWTDTPAEPPRP